MRKFLLTAAVFAASFPTLAGGYLTNTNQSVSFLRNPARLATFELDGAYSNPAGLAWLGEGWHFAFNWQNAAQERNILSTFSPFAYNVNQPGNPVRKFKGEASAPLFLRSTPHIRKALGRYLCTLALPAVEAKLPLTAACLCSRLPCRSFLAC